MTDEALIDAESNKERRRQGLSMAQIFAQLSLMGGFDYGYGLEREGHEGSGAARAFSLHGADSSLSLSQPPSARKGTNPNSASARKDKESKRARTPSKASEPSEMQMGEDGEGLDVLDAEIRGESDGKSMATPRPMRALAGKSALHSAASSSSSASSRSARSAGSTSSGSGSGSGSGRKRKRASDAMAAFSEDDRERQLEEDDLLGLGVVAVNDGPEMTQDEIDDAKEFDAMGLGVLLLLALDNSSP